MEFKKEKFDIMVDVWARKQFCFRLYLPLCGLPDENREAFMLHLLQKLWIKV